MCITQTHLSLLQFFRASVSDGFYDSPPPPHRSDCLQRTVHGCSTRRTMPWKIYIQIFVVCQGPSNDDVGVARGILYKRIRPGAGFKNGYFVKKNVEEATTVD